MFIDSHCHLTFPQLSQDIDGVLARMHSAAVRGAMNVCTKLEEFDQILALAQAKPNIVATVGVHPDSQNVQEPDVHTLTQLAQHPRVRAIGETGLDYFRLKEPLEWQRERFRVHIRAARAVGKPLVIHTRAAAQDTLRIMRDEGADQVGGVMHCFTESAQVAKAALDLGFCISFSGILTFKSATDLQQLSQWVPLDRLLIETDAPYLAPVPHRGKTNEPGYVPLVAAKLAALRGISLEDVAHASSDTFIRVFKDL